MTVFGAVLIVAALSLLTITVIDTFDGGDDDAVAVGLGVEEPPATDEDDADDESDDDGEVRRTTTTTRPSATTTSEPEVLGDVTTRDDEPAPTTTAAPRPTGPSSPPATVGTTLPPSTTTTTTCQDSRDPACGPLRWEPEPAPYEVQVEEVSVPLRAVVGEELTLRVDVVERAGADAIGACASWAVDDPGVPNVSTCEAVNHSCDRYGPHQPPAPRTDRVPVTRTFSFTEPGEREVTVSGHTATHLADGCANPYLASFSRTYVIVVEAEA